MKRRLPCTASLTQIQRNIGFADAHSCIKKKCPYVPLFPIALIISDNTATQIRNRFSKFLPNLLISFSNYFLTVNIQKRFLKIFRCLFLSSLVSLWSVNGHSTDNKIIPGEISSKTKTLHHIVMLYCWKVFTRQDITGKECYWPLSFLFSLLPTVYNKPLRRKPLRRSHYYSHRIIKYLDLFFVPRLVPGFLQPCFYRPRNRSSKFIQGYLIFIFTLLIFKRFFITMI